MLIAFCCSAASLPKTSPTLLTASPILAAPSHWEANAAGSTRTPRTAASASGSAARAIGAFERQLVTPARWDRYLRGDTSALSEEEKTGFQTFIEVGCATCHSGTLLGGASYERAGRVEPWPNLQDAGRYEVTKKEGDRYVFKVPSLRNISETGPYFHDGSVSNLSDAVSRMASAQLGRKLSAQQIASIVTWLGALTGPLSPDAISKPELPPSGPRTPAPDPT